MVHQCVHCGKIIEVGSKEILEGCDKCHGKFFFYIKDEALAQRRREAAMPVEFNEVDKEQVEKDVRSILKIEDEDEPVILDLETIRVLKPGKFELDLVSLFNRRPVVFKLEEGKYIIDLESALPKK